MSHVDRTNEPTTRSLMLAVLEILSKQPKAHRMNLIGRGHTPGGIENHMRTTFSAQDRARADRAMRQLESDGLIAPTFDDLVDPLNWIAITEPGRLALQDRCLDDLDKALYEIRPSLAELRAGAWAAAASAQPDSARQAAHSARELIAQMLSIAAPDEAVRSMPGFTPDKTSRTGITRRHRLKYIMAKRSTRSDSALGVAEAACDLVEAAHDRATAQAHSRVPVSSQQAADTIEAAEIALRAVLI